MHVPNMWSADSCQKNKYGRDEALKGKANPLVYEYEQRKKGKSPQGKRHSEPKELCVV